MNTLEISARQVQKGILTPIFMICLLCSYVPSGAHCMWGTGGERQKKGLGIVLGMNTTDFRIDRLDSDTIEDVRSFGEPGFTLGITALFPLSSHLNLRLIPSMALTDRGLEFTEYQVDDPVLQSLPSINFELPLLLDYRLNPGHVLRPFFTGGLKYTYDVATKAESRTAVDMVRLHRHDLNSELGLGLEINLPSFVVEPEIRFSYGLLDIHSPDPSLRFSNALERLSGRGLLFSVSLRGGVK